MRIFFIPMLCILLVGCQKSSNLAWENIKTAGKYFGKGIGALWGKGDGSGEGGDFLGPVDAEYIPLDEKDLNSFSTDISAPKPKLVPGKGIPGIDSFASPIGELASILKMLHFETDDHVVRKKDDLVAIHKISEYLKKNKNIYLSVEGHCDERASAGYNMALGARRANHVRVLLIKQGVDFNRIYTVSHGKEKPLVLGHSEDDWRRNRRVEFKVYKR